MPRIALLRLRAAAAVALAHCAAPALTAATQASFYVAPAPTGSDSNAGTLEQPFATITKARDTVRTLNGEMTGDINVYLRGGTYELTSTLAFAAADSATNGNKIIYQAYGAEKPILSGGKRITGWSQVSGQKYYSADVPTGSGYAAYFRQIWVDGRRARQAQSDFITQSRTVAYDDPATTQAKDGYFVKAADLKAYINLSQLRIFQEGDFKHIEQSVVAIVDVVGGERAFAMKQPDFLNWTNTYTYKQDRQLRIVNAFEELDEPGEFYLNEATRVVYYFPHPGENLATAEVIAPGVDYLVKIQGTATHRLANLVFEGITFVYGNWSPAGTVEIGRSQADLLPNYTSIPGQLWLDYTDGVQIKNCRFEHHASSGVYLLNDNANTLIEGNVFNDLTAAAVLIGTSTSQGLTSALANRDTTVANNVVRNIGADFTQASGIYANTSKNLKIYNNDVADVAYFGINQRYSTDQTPPSATFVGNTEIFYNRVANYGTAAKYGMGLADENQGIYFFGVRDSRVFKNYVTYGGKGENLQGAYRQDQYGYNNRWEFNVADTKPNQKSFSTNGGIISEVIFDNNYANAADAAPGWAVTTGFPDQRYGTNYAFYGASGGSPSAWAMWRPTIATAGNYDVFLRWVVNPGGSARPNAAPIEVTYTGGTDTGKTVDQTLNGGTWVKIGTYNFSAGTGNSLKLKCSDDGTTIADAAKFTPVAGGPDVIVDNTDPGFSTAQGMVFSNFKLESSAPAWSPAAQAIIDAAGLAPAFKYLLTDQDSGINLTLGRPATSSATYATGFDPAKAVDGNPATLWDPNQTSAPLGSWWQVELEQPCVLTKIQLLARWNNDPTQLAERRNFEIRASNDPAFATYTVLGGQDDKAFAYTVRSISVAGTTLYPYNAWDLYVTNSGGFKYLRVVSAGINFAEFRAYGYAVPKTTILTTSASSVAAGTSFALTANVTSPSGPSVGTVTFKAGATTLGTAALGASGAATLTTSLAVAGSYPLTATLNAPNQLFSSTSPPVVITVYPAVGSPSAKLTNLSVRSTIAANQVLIVGLTMQGGPKPTLLRAVGPSLGAFGVTGAMANPRLALYHGSMQEAANERWGGDTAIASAGAAVGAFPFATTDSLDSALLRTIDGGRTVQVSGPSAGTVLVEAYDAGPGTSPRLVNISARNLVATGRDVLIAGFVIAGEGRKSLLIRAAGPSLAALGVSDAITDPKIEIFDSTQARIAENDNFAAADQPFFAAAGAFAFVPGAKDAALIASLPPGGYSAVVSGVDGATGVALVEVYELP